jgi:DNA polymerase-3 subunit epsilon/ATP-dependent DNA helicase DinG
MTLLQNASPLEEAWVALDLETTGLSPKSDEIIEIGAVKFLGDEEVETFQSFVNPGRQLSDFIVDLTGINQSDVDQAPGFGSVAPELAVFLGSAPIVGHNVDFDLGFLKAKGMRLSNQVCDTWELAYVLRPDAKAYGLEALAGQLNANHDKPHRAMDDAQATRGVFVTLVKELADLDPATLEEMNRLAQRSNWKLKHVLNSIQPTGSTGTKPRRRPSIGDIPVGGTSRDRTRSDVGLNTRALSERLKQDRPLRPNERVIPVDQSLVEEMLQSGSVFAEAMGHFDERPEQIEMAGAVTETLNSGGRLIAEAGTGVGKSIAYLLPAAIYAALNNRRVVVSTNTINLQEQLVTKDLPMMLKAMASVPELSDLDVRFTQLKGRANYLCVRKWQNLRSSDSTDEAEARMLAKTLKWLEKTETGDRSELNLGHRAASAPWERLSAQGSHDCVSSGGPCFLRAARERAAASHIVVVNHALLLSDLAMGGSVIPEYDILIIDEAHHLEEQATRQLGFELPQSAFDDQFQAITGEPGLFNEALMAIRRSSSGGSRQKSIEEANTKATAQVPQTRETLTRLFNSMTSALFDASQGQRRPTDEARVTSSTRSQPVWSDLEIEWENADILLSELGTLLGELNKALEGLEDNNISGYDGLMTEVAEATQQNSELRKKLSEFVVQPKDDGIYWATRSARSQGIVLHAAPLDVGDTLDELLFSQKESVVLTSATLSTDGNFKHVIERVGFRDSQQLLLGSPFNYEEAALLCVPKDMPEPNADDYQRAVNWAVTRAAESSGGRAMALFTSHASLRACALAIRAPLKAMGLNVLAQGVDGTPQQLVSRFLENPESVLLGTASFWEGVDLAGDALRVLLVTRLPFNVPSEPVFAARSEQYEDSFNQYAVPQAILKLRQGFGRLIRTKTDRGVAIILDQRILARRYGQAFIQSLPSMTIEACSMREFPDKIERWLEG